MAQDFAPLFRSIWSDADFRALPVDAQHIYMMLMSHPDRNAAGVLPLMVRKWTRLARDLSVDRLEAALTELDGRGFIVLDDETDEVLVRSHIRRTKVYRHIRLLVNALREVTEVDSSRVRLVLLQELARLPRLSIPENPKMKAEAEAAQVRLDELVESMPSPKGPGHGVVHPMAHPMADPMGHPPVVGAGAVVGVGAVAPRPPQQNSSRGVSHVSSAAPSAPPRFPDHCQRHANEAEPGKCGECADARKARQVRPALSLVSDRPDWCGECHEWTRLRDYDGTPYRCPTCHPLAEESA
jgi:hypothetical protein